MTSEEQVKVFDDLLNTAITRPDIAAELADEFTASALSSLARARAHEAWDDVQSAIAAYDTELQSAQKELDVAIDRATRRHSRINAAIASLLATVILTIILLVANQTRWTWWLLTILIVLEAVVITYGIFWIRDPGYSTQWSQRDQERYSLEQKRLLSRISAELLEVGMLPLLRKILNERKETNYGTRLGITVAPGLFETSDPHYEVDTNAWARLRSILHTRSSGSVAVAGPRGAGKTTLLRAAVDGRITPDILEQDLIGIFQSAPVRYDTLEFLLNLLRRLTTAALSRTQSENWTEFTLPIRGKLRIYSFILATVCLTVGAGLVVGQTTDTVAGFAVGVLLFVLILLLATIPFSPNIWRRMGVAARLGIMRGCGSDRCFGCSRGVVVAPLGPRSHNNRCLRHTIGSDPGRLDRTV
jgi:hypothetical protein